MGEKEEGPRLGLSWPALFLPCLPLGGPVSFNPVTSELGLGLVQHEGPATLE